MSTDLQLLTGKSGKITAAPIGTSQDTGLMLFQRLLTIMLAGDAYRNGYSKTNRFSLMSELYSGNQPSDSALESYMDLMCTNVLSVLDSGDRSRVEYFRSSVTNGTITLVLKLVDGTKLTGAIDV